jgi:hypothetical protein
MDSSRVCLQANTNKRLPALERGERSNAPQEGGIVVGGGHVIVSVSLNSAPTDCWPSPSELAITLLPAERYDQRRQFDRLLLGRFK